MIIWISSYPKSGNTFLRLLLAEYFFNKTSNQFDINVVDQISRYPKLNFFNPFIKEGLLIKENLKNRNKFLQLTYEAQYKIFKKGTFFLKTHCKNYIENNLKFTDAKVTKAAIYIIRDPRNVLFSYADYFNISINEAYDQITSETEIEYENSQIKYPGIIGSWGSNYLSWKNSSNEFPVKIIKYEDLTSKTYSTFFEILNYLKNIKVINSIDTEKVKKTIKNTNLDNLKRIEKKIGFKEKNIKSDKPFFNLGEKRDWKLIYKKENVDFINNINNVFKNEMKELGYLK
tara:strand:+ start:214 stop:1074 length:861 start_codon:yes stop_codon:yes gene_type:complete